MLEGVLTLRPFCDRHFAAYPELLLTEDEWSDIVELTEALSPAKITTKILQSEQLTLGDFYGSWLTCKLKTQKIGTRFATAVLDSMNQREKLILTSDGFVAAIVLDPRYVVRLKRVGFNLIRL